MDAFTAQIITQVNYYFSPENLPYDAHLRSLMHPLTGWVALAEIVKFGCMVRMGATHAPLVAQALRHSAMVEIDSSGCFVRPRIYPMHIPMPHMTHPHPPVNGAPVTFMPHPHLPVPIAASAPHCINPTSAPFVVYPQMPHRQAPPTEHTAPGAASAHVPKQGAMYTAPPPAQPFGMTQPLFVPQRFGHAVHPLMARMVPPTMNGMRTLPPMGPCNPMFARMSQPVSHNAQWVSHEKTSVGNAVQPRQDASVAAGEAGGVSATVADTPKDVPTVSLPPAMSGCTQQTTGLGRRKDEEDRDTEEGHVLMFGNPPFVVVVGRKGRVRDGLSMPCKDRESEIDTGDEGGKEKLTARKEKREIGDLEIGSEVSSKSPPPGERVIAEFDGRETREG